MAHSFTHVEFNHRNCRHHSPQSSCKGVDFGTPHFDHELEELGLLAETARFRVAGQIDLQNAKRLTSPFVGSGKAEIKLLVVSHGANEVLFDQSLSPAQQRNLERFLGAWRSMTVLLILGKFLPSVPANMKANSGLSWPWLQYLSHTAGQALVTLGGVQRGGVGAGVALAKHKSNSTDACCPRVSNAPASDLKKSKTTCHTAQAARSPGAFNVCHWWATPTQENPLFSTPW